MSEQRLPTQDLDKYVSLRTIHEEELSDVVSLDQLTSWAGRNKNDFPKPLRIGRYVLYEKDQVVAWVTLWMKINMNFKHDNAYTRNKEVS